MKWEKYDQNWNFKRRKYNNKIDKENFQKYL